MDEKPDDRQYANQYRDYAQRQAERVEGHAERMARRVERRGCGGRHPAAGGMVVASIIIVAGVLMLLDNFGILHARDFWQFWPLIFVIGGIGKVLDSRGRSSGTLLGMVFIAVGVIW